MGFPARRNLRVYRGDGYAHEIEFVDDAGDPIDYSDGSFAAQWRPSRSSDTAVDFTVDDTDAATGVIVLHLTSEQTSEVRRGVWDLQYTPTGAEPSTLLQGEVVVESEVTR